MERKNRLISVEYSREFNPTTMSVEESNILKLDNTAIQKGLIKGLGYVEFAVLIAITSHCGSEGEAFPSQRRIAELTGASLATVNKAVNKLLDTKVGGSPILSRELLTLPQGKKMSIYKVGGESPDTSKEVKNNYEVNKELNSKDVALYFKRKYEEVYSLPYSINYSRELGMIKTKLIKEYKSDQILKIIDYTLDNYLTKWASTSYPYPTIPMLCSWLSNTALQNMTAKDKEQEQLEAIITEQAEDTDYTNYNL